MPTTDMPPRPQRPRRPGRRRSPQTEIDKVPRLKHFLHSAIYSGVVPDVVDWTGNISYGVDGNDENGDCIAAAAAHCEETWSALGSGQLVNPTTEQVLTFWKAFQKLPDYQRDDMLAALEYWQSTGMAGHKILGWFAIDPSDLEEMRAALWLFGPLFIGFNYPASADKQFDAGKPWTVVGNDRAIDGHCVALHKMVKGANLTVSTWGQLQEMTPEWWAKYQDEPPYAPLSQEWINSATHLTPSHLDFAAANAAVAQLSGKPGPFVGPAAPSQPPSQPPSGPSSPSGPSKPPANPPPTNQPPAKPPKRPCFLAPAVRQVRRAIRNHRRSP